MNWWIVAGLLLVLTEAIYVFSVKSGIVDKNDGILASKVWSFALAVVFLVWSFALAVVFLVCFFGSWLLLKLSYQKIKAVSIPVIQVSSYIVYAAIIIVAVLMWWRINVKLTEWLRRDKSVFSEKKGGRK